MQRTRLSLSYLAGYLIPAGVMLLVLGNGALTLLGSDRDYGPHITRVLGIMLLSLSVLIVQFIRHRADALYPSTVVVRFGILVTLLVARGLCELSGPGVARTGGGGADRHGADRHEHPPRPARTLTRV